MTFSRMALSWRRTQSTRPAVLGLCLWAGCLACGAAPTVRSTDASAEGLLAAADSRSDAVAEQGTAPDGEDREGWMPLFDGRSLEGWMPKIAGQALGRDERQIFRVEDGVLKVSYENYEQFQGEFGHLFYETPFSHYRLRVEYRFTGEQTPGGPGWAWRNSGVMLHGQSPESMGTDQEFPVSLELQLLGGDGQNTRPTANLCTPGTDVDIAGQPVSQHCINAEAPTFHGDGWVTVEAEVMGGERVRHLVNGRVVLEYSRLRYDPDDADARRLPTFPRTWVSGGYLSLQAESHGVEFRRVDVMPLDS